MACAARGSERGWALLTSAQGAERLRALGQLADPPVELSWRLGLRQIEARTPEQPEEVRAALKRLPEGPPPASTRERCRAVSGRAYAACEQVVRLEAPIERMTLWLEVVARLVPLHEPPPPVLRQEPVPNGDSALSG